MTIAETLMKSKGTGTGRQETWQGDPNGVPMTPSGHYVMGSRESQRRGPQDSNGARPTRGPRLRGF